MTRRENDSIFCDFKGQTDAVRLDLVSNDTPVDVDMVVTGVHITDLEDDSTDMHNGYFRVNLKQPDGNWKEIRGKEFTYELQRELQPQLEKAGVDSNGHTFGNRSTTFAYAYIPLHEARALNQR